MLKVDQWKLMTTDRMRINGIRGSVPTPRVYQRVYQRQCSYTEGVHSTYIISVFGF